MAIAYERAEAESYLNSIRNQMQMIRLRHNDQLDVAAQAHATYLVQNNAFSHNEIEGYENFTGVHPYDRAFKAGYHTSMVSENLSTKNKNSHRSLNGLFSAIYHRFAFLDPSMDELGIGITQDKQITKNSAFVYVMGNQEIDHLCRGKSFHGTGKYIYHVCKEREHRIEKGNFNQALDRNRRDNPKIIVYPYDGQVEVPPAFYEEIPDPLPDYEVSGFPISVIFNEYFFEVVALHSFKLFTLAGKEVSDVRLMGQINDPNKKFTDKQYALFPLKRLAYDSTYRAEIIYEIKGEQHTLSWTFHTKKLAEKLHIVTQKEESVTLKSGESHIVYFRPRHGGDFLTNVLFPSHVDVAFIDNNTIRITVNDPSLDRFDIRSKKWVLHVKMD